MARLANISGKGFGRLTIKEAAKAFQKAGWRTLGQVGSHRVMVKPGMRVNLPLDFARHKSVPQHKELSVGTLRALIRHAGIDVEEFLSLL